MTLTEAQALVELLSSLVRRGVHVDLIATSEHGKQVSNTQGYGVQIQSQDHSALIRINKADGYRAYGAYE